MKILGIIPARYNSSRFPGKPLAQINNKSMIQMVWEQCKKAKLLSDCIVATDDERIYNHVLSFGGKAMMTRDDHQSGTDRCFEVISKEKNTFDAVINIQGDEPLIDENYIDKLGKTLTNGAQIATLAHPLNNDEVDNPNKVKVTFSEAKKALYFSRSVIPFDRNSSNPKYFGHIGIYGYQTNVLKQIAQLPSSTLELAESLEQLRWLENDFSIVVDVVKNPSIGIDTPEDLEKLLKSLNN